MLKPGRRITSVAADVFYVSDGVETHTAAVLASIAMMLKAHQRSEKSVINGRFLAAQAYS